MSDSLVEDRLTTADIATPRQARAAAMERRLIVKSENQGEKPGRYPSPQP